MPESLSPASARATSRTEGAVLAVDLEGPWRLDSDTPRWSGVVNGSKPAAVRLSAERVSHWDTSLVVFLGEAQHWCKEAGVACDTTPLPEKMKVLSGQFEAALRTRGQDDHTTSLVVEVGLATRFFLQQRRNFLQFVGECWIDTTKLVTGKAGLRWSDCIAEMQRCGAMALPIVSLISFLVGVTLAYSGSIVLKRFGGEIWVADLIGVAMTREMGCLMAAVVLSGRTGAAFAAEIGSMKANEEIDALSTLGISPVRFLVMPRVLALGLMMPLLALYANCLGILGGMAVAFTTLDIPPAAYWVEMLTIVSVQDVAVGLIKAVVFGIIVGLTGCLRGLEADRNASGVGRAATSAVVTAILLIIVADALFAVLFNFIGL
ncbi:MAG TPA: ABC transporter permease [Opitutaceae bacterium]|jgi:phospholipid/cholesterol/gamma-HCH transport system permease protein|nr:ABC transporter permease [Opitutaceae bacterium]